MQIDTRENIPNAEVVRAAYMSYFDPCQQENPIAGSPYIKPRSPLTVTLDMLGIARKWKENKQRETPGSRESSMAFDPSVDYESQLSPESRTLLEEIRAIRRSAGPVPFKVRDLIYKIRS